MNTQLCKTILEIVISLAIQSGAIIGAALAVSKWLGRRGAAHQAIILRSAIVAVLLCAALSFGLAGRIHPLFSLSLPAIQAQAISSVDTASPIDSPASPVNTDQDALPSGSASDQTAAVKASAVPAPRNTAVRETPVATVSARHGIPVLSRLYFAGAVVWLAGALVLMIWLLACQCHLFLIARRASPVSSDPAWEALQSLWPESSSRPRLLASRAAKSPFIAGVWKPSIFVPIDFEERFAPDAIALVIAHELCHLRRRDGLWILLARLTRIALWVQPLAWLLERRLQDTFEALCDAEVIAQGQVSASRYADCLVGMAEHLTMPPALRAVGLGVVPFRSSLGKRVQTILSGTISLVQPITPALRMAIAVGAATLALAGVLLITARIPSRAAASESPTSVVQEYLDDLSNGQIAQAYALFSPATQQEMPLESFQTSGNTVLFGSKGASANGDTLFSIYELFHDPHASLGYRFEVVGPSTNDPNAVTLKVYPPGITLANSFTLDVVTVPDPTEDNAPRIDMAKTMSVIDPNAPKAFADQAKAAECLDHLKRLVLATLQYTQDHDDVFPDAPHWADEIAVYIARQPGSIFSDPFGQQGAMWGFAFNSKLSHVHTSQLSNPSQTVLFFESTANKKNASDSGQSLAKPSGLNGGSYFAFADGHVKLIQGDAHPSFLITPDQVSATPQTFRVFLNSVQPGQTQGVYLQIVDPNSKYQQATGFAIPPGSPYLGVQYAPATNFKKSSIVTNVPPEIVKSGMVVVRVVPGSPAATAGIQRDDVIFEAGGKSLDGSVMLLRQVIENHKSGQPMSLVVYSHGKTRTVTVIVGKAPAVQKQSLAPSSRIPVTDYGLLPNGKPKEYWVVLKPDEAAARSRLRLANSEIRITRQQLRLIAHHLKTKKYTLSEENNERILAKAFEAQMVVLNSEQIVLTRFLQHEGPFLVPSWSTQLVTSVGNVRKR